MTALTLWPILLVFCACAIAVLGVRRKQSQLYDKSASGIYLRYSPNRLKGIDLLFLVISIVSKYIPGTVGYGAKLKRDQNVEQQFALPAIEVSGALELDERDVARFNRALFQDSSQTDNPMLLVAITAPLIIFLLSLHDCPIKPLGAVNTRNVFHFVRPDICRDSAGLLQASSRGELRYRASFGGDARPGVRRKRGMEFCIHIDVVDDRDSIIVKQELFFLQFLKSNVQPRFSGKSEETSEAPTEDVEITDLPQLLTTSPRAWAASCGDYNPIHISRLAAKLFGFRSVIAHGNHVVALALQASTNPRPLHKLDVRFVRPMILPARLQVSWSERSSSQSSHTLQFLVKRQSDVHILGTLE